MSRLANTHCKEKTQPGTDAIEYPAAAEIHQAVGNQKRRIQCGLHLIGNWKVGLYHLDDPRQGLPIQITDRDRQAD
jgi:hypothetical protein